MQIYTTWHQLSGAKKERHGIALLFVVGVLLICVSYLYRFTVTDRQYDVPSISTLQATIAEE